MAGTLAVRLVGLWRGVGNAVGDEPHWSESSTASSPRGEGARRAPPPYLPGRPGRGAIGRSLNWRSTPLETEPTERSCGFETRPTSRVLMERCRSGNRTRLLSGCRVSGTGGQHILSPPKPSSLPTGHGRTNVQGRRALASVPGEFVGTNGPFVVGRQPVRIWLSAQVNLCEQAAPVRVSMLE